MDERQNLEKEAQAAVEQIVPPQSKPNRAPLVVFAIIVLLSLVGYGVYAWQNNRVAQLEDQVADLKKTTAPSPADPYAGWKTYTTKYEKVTFRYPATMTLKDESFVDARPGAIPGVDLIHLMAASGLQLYIRQGAYDVERLCAGCTIAKSDPITFLSNSNYLNYISKPGSTNITSIELATKNTAYVSGLYASKNIAMEATKEPTDNLYEIGYFDADAMGIPKPLATFASDPDMKNFKLVLQSLTY